MMTRPARPPSLHDTEASHATLKAIPGSVVVQLLRDMESERHAGQPCRRMFIELSLSEALEHHRKLGLVIAQAGAMGSSTPGKDAAPLL